MGEPHYGDITNICRVTDDAGELSYDFLISYCGDATPYNHRDECVEQEINFIETGTGYDVNSASYDFRQRSLTAPATLPYDTEAHDVWWWNPCTN